MQEIVFTISLSAAEFMAYYEGQVQDILVTSIDGKRVRFPAKYLQPFLLHDGIHGAFVIVYDDQNRFVKIQRLVAKGE